MKTYPGSKYLKEQEYTNVPCAYLVCPYKILFKEITTIERWKSADFGATIQKTSEHNTCKMFFRMWFKKKSDLTRKELSRKIAVSQGGGGKMTFLLLLQSQKERKWNVLCALPPKRHKTRLKIVIKKVKRQKNTPSTSSPLSSYGNKSDWIERMGTHLVTWEQISLNWKECVDVCLQC